MNGVTSKEDSGLRGYQRDACNAVVSSFNRGVSSIVLVSPPGSGKTRMATSIGRRALSAGKTVVGVVHRVELVEQLEAIGIPVCTAQSEPRGGVADLLIADEAHHYITPVWGRHLASAKCVLGLTATPERGDGQPLGSEFDEMVVAADYPELISDGYLMDAQIVRPSSPLGSDLAMDPVEALAKFKPNGRAFVYASSKAHAKKLCEQFNAAGFTAGYIDAETRGRTRKFLIESFSSGLLQVLINIHTLTEGVNVVEADTCIIARGVSNPTTYLQMVGRILRVSSGKRPLIIDLPGCSWSWGLVNEPRIYTLAKGITLEKSIPVYECPRCGWAQHERITCCARCEWTPDSESKQKPPKVYTQEMREQWDGEDTPASVKKNELERLLKVCRDGGWALSWVVDKYKKSFGETISLDVPDEEKRENMWKWMDRGIGRKWANFQYKRTFGHWPRRR